MKTALVVTCFFYDENTMMKIHRPVKKNKETQTGAIQTKTPPKKFFHFFAWTIYIQ